MTPLKRLEYIHISIKDIPEEIINAYQLRKIVDDKGSIHIQANRGMYGSPQVGITREATNKANWSPDFGHVIGDQSSSRLL